MSNVKESDLSEYQPIENQTFPYSTHDFVPLRYAVAHAARANYESLSGKRSYVQKLTWNMLNYAPYSVLLKSSKSLEPVSLQHIRQPHRVASATLPKEAQARHQGWPEREHQDTSSSHLHEERCDTGIHWSQEVINITCNSSGSLFALTTNSLSDANKLV